MSDHTFDVSRLLGEVAALRAEVAQLQAEAAALRAGLAWVLQAGGWRLWHHADTPPPSVIVVGAVGEPATIATDAGLPGAALLARLQAAERVVEAWRTHQECWATLGAGQSGWCLETGGALEQALNALAAYDAAGTEPDHA